MRNPIWSKAAYNADHALQLMSVQGAVGSFVVISPASVGRVDQCVSISAVARIKTNRRAVCLEVLQALPEWFSRPQAVEDYARVFDELPMFGFSMNDEIVGLLALKFHTTVAAKV
jgi:hypothetical protein